MFEKHLTKAILLSVSAVSVLKCCFWSLCSLEWNRGFCSNRFIRLCHCGGLSVEELNCCSVSLYFNSSLQTYKLDCVQLLLLLF